MGRYLDFEDDRYEKGFEPFQLNAENIKANKGRKICYLLRRDIDRHRGYFVVRRGVECGIEIQEPKSNTNEKANTI